MALIEIRQLTKLYRMGDSIVRALDGVDLTIEEGDFVAITGASGSGKSTMMHLLGCLDRPTSGVYRLNGRDVAGMPDGELAGIRNREIGFVFQTFNLINRTSAMDNVGVPIFYARRTNTRGPSLRALERVGLGKRSHHKPNELSGGERQRVAIARAIVNDPLLVLADEPTGNLDTRTGEQIMQIFHELNAQGVTIIVVTHEVEVAMQARRIVQMRDGKIVSDRATSDVSSDAQLQTAATLGAARATVGGAVATGARPAALSAARAGIAPSALAADPHGALVREHAALARPARSIASSHAGGSPAAEEPAEAALPPAKRLPSSTQALWLGLVGAGLLIAIMVAQSVLAALRPDLMKPPDPGAAPTQIKPEQAVIGTILLVVWLLSLVLGLIALFRGRSALRQIREERGFWTGVARARAGFWLGTITVVLPFALPLIRLLAQLP